MKYGNWIGMAKGFVDDLPLDRPYTKLEAMYSLSVDYDNHAEVTVAGYSSLWRWSRSRVRKFIQDFGLQIIYPSDCKKTRNKKGHIAIHKKDIKETYKRHKRFIDNNNLQEEKDIKKTKEEHKKDIKPSTTSNPNPNPNKKDDYGCEKFQSFWKEYPRKVSKKEAYKAWVKNNCANGHYEKIIKAISSQKKKWDDPKFIPHAASWINGERWKDEEESNTGKTVGGLTF